MEQQIYSIEAANINQETLNAMKNAGNAMKSIHNGLTIDKVDQTMYVLYHMFTSLLSRSIFSVRNSAKPFLVSVQDTK